MELFGLLLRSTLVLSVTCSLVPVEKLSKFRDVGEDFFFPLIHSSEVIHNVAQTTNISNDCRLSLDTVIESIRRHDDWAFKSKFYSSL